MGELSYLHSRDITYATSCQGPYAESVRYRDFMGCPKTPDRAVGQNQGRVLPHTVSE